MLLAFWWVINSHVVTGFSDFIAQFFKQVMMLFQNFICIYYLTNINFCNFVKRAQLELMGIFETVFNNTQFFFFKAWCQFFSLDCK